MGKKLDALLGKGFKSSKCTALLKMSVSRIKLLRNKREIQCRQTRKDIAQLLQNGQEASARIRVEHVFREQNILDAYFLIEGFCYLVTERMVSIENQRTCPNDLKEAVASLIFAAARCADLPELQDIRSLFAAKYGNEFSTAAVELHPDCGVNRRIIEKLSTRAPSAEVKLRLLKEIAAENGIELSFEKAEMEMLKPAEDLLDGPKHFLAGSQAISKPADSAKQVSVPENAKANSEHDKRTHPPAVTQSMSVAYSPLMFPATPSLDEGAKNTEQFLPSANQGHASLHNAEKYDSPPLQAPSYRTKEELVGNPRAARNLETKVSEEEDPYTRLRMEGKMDYHASTKSKNSTTEFLSSSYYCGSTKFTKVDGASFDPTQDTSKYTDAAAAAQAAFESAALAAEAARAAVNLAKSEGFNGKSTQSGDDWKDVSSESELDEALEAALSKSIHVLGSDTEEMSSAMDGEAVGEKNSRARRHETNDISYPGFGFSMVHPSQKVNTDSDSEEEPLEAQVSLPRTGRSRASNYSQRHFDVCNDVGDEYGSNALSKNGKLDPKQEYAERPVTPSKRPMSRGATDSGDKYSSYRVAQPVFDNYDDEDEYDKASSGKTSYQSTLNRCQKSEQDGSSNWSAAPTANRSQFDSNDEVDQNEKVMSRRQHRKQDYISEIEREPEKFKFQLRPWLGRHSEDEGEVKALRSQRSGTSTRSSKPSFDEDEGELKATSPQRSGASMRSSKISLSEAGGEAKASRSQRSARSSKPSFEEFVRQETRSFQNFNPQSDDGIESLSDFERIKFQNRSKASIVRRPQPEDRYDPSHGRTLRQGIGATMSDDHSTFSAHAEVHKNYEPCQGADSIYSDFQSSDNNNGIDRYGGAGKARRHYENRDDQDAFAEGRRPQNSYHLTQLGFGEDNKAFRGLEIGERSISDGEYSKEMPQNRNAHPEGLGNESKLHFVREDVQSTYSYRGSEPSEPHLEEGGSRIYRMGQHKATHHGESRRSLITQQQLREQQSNSPNVSSHRPSNKKVERQSINTGYTSHNDPLTISPTSSLFAAKSTHATINQDSERDSSPFMRPLPPPPPPPVGTDDDAKQTKRSSKPKPPFEQLPAIPSSSSYANDEFSERLEALRRKR